jgi:hypothetical protein
MIKAPNIGGIVAQNEAEQAQVNDNALARQLNLIKIQQAQQEAQKSQKLQELFAKGVDISTPEGARQVMAYDPGLAKTGYDIYSTIQKTALEQSKEARNAAFQEKEYNLKAMDTTSQINNRNNDNAAKWANIGIQQQQFLAARQEAQAKIGKDAIDAMDKIAMQVALTPPDQQQAIANRLMEQAKDYYPNATKDWNPNDPKRLQELNLYGQASLLMEEQSTKKGTTVNINQGGGKFLEEIGKGSAQQALTDIEVAKKAVDQYKTAQSVIDIVNQGSAITGAGAEYRLAIANALATTGLIDEESIAATEQLASNLARQTLDSIKSSGLGTGQGFANADREFLSKAASGQIQFSREGLIRIAELNKKAAISAHAKGVEAIKRINQNEGGAAALGGYRLPALPIAPDGDSDGSVQKWERDANGNPVKVQ